MKAEADVIVDPAPPHRPQRGLHHAERSFLARTHPVAEEKPEVVRRWELGGAAEATLQRIVRPRQLLVGLIESCPAQLPRFTGGLAAGRLTRGLAAVLTVDALPKGGTDLARRVQRLAALLRPQLLDPRHKVDQTDPAVPGFPREVRAGEERVPVRRHDDRQGPATVACHHLGHRHVDLVYVGALLTIDLYAHERVVQEPCDVSILERLALHHVAPVAGGVAYGEEDRPVFTSGGLESVLAPRVPVDRIVGVLQEVRALLPDQTIGARPRSGLRVVAGGAAPAAGATLVHRAPPPLIGRPGRARERCSWSRFRAAPPARSPSRRQPPHPLPHTCDRRRHSPGGR